MDEPSQADRRQWVLRAVADHEAALRRYAARMLRDADAAGDVVQHVFLKLCEQSPEEIGPRLVPWLFHVCRNRVLDMARQRQRTESLSPAAQQASAPASDPAAQAERADLLRHLGVLIDGLPVAQREALALWREGLRYRQIAEVTGGSEGHVRVLVHRALMRLREDPSVRQAMGWQERVAECES